MGQNHQHRPDTEESLTDITLGLEKLRENLIDQLSEEIEELQTQKRQLRSEISQLESRRQEQLQQQEDLVQKIAPALADRLQLILQQRLKQEANGSQENIENLALREHQDHTHGLISELDSTLKNTFQSLQQDLSSYQSSLAQQLGQMYSLEQQGEEILEALVGRLRSEVSPAQPHLPEASRKPAQDIPTLPPQDTPKPPPAKKTKIPIRQRITTNQVRWGFFLVLLSSLALSLQNVVIRIILKPTSIFGTFETGGFISSSFANSLFILCLRMIVVVPLMIVMANYLYPKTRQEILRVSPFRDRKLFFNVALCGFFLFVSSALIYLAIGYLSPGVAVTMFFVFPIVTLFCSWLFFGERPSWVRVLAALTVFGGVILIKMGISGAEELPIIGAICALGAGITFAFHVLLIQACTRKIHPVPFSLANFIAILGFAAISIVIVPLAGFPIEVDASMYPSLLISGGILGILTLLSYLTNNIGISYIGAARASIFGATGPAFTSLVTWMVIGETLVGWQIAGMLVVTAGVMGLSLERILKR